MAAPSARGLFAAMGMASKPVAVIDPATGAIVKAAGRVLSNTAGANPGLSGI